MKIRLRRTCPGNCLVIAERGEESVQTEQVGHTVDKVNMVAALENEGEADQWSTPTKVSRSPAKTKETELEQTLSNSRFAILSSEEEEGEISQQVCVGSGAIEKLQQDEGSPKDVDSAKTLHQEKEVVTKELGTTRPSLPRLSKERHTLVSSSTVQKTNDCGQSLMNKKSTRKNN